MVNLAIRGHKTRGKEVIAILEMLGGENKYQVTAIRETHVYFVDDDNISFLKINQLLPEQFIVFTLEEFLEKYPYKVGDFVRIPEYESEVYIDDMKWFGFEIQYSVSADETEYLYEWYSVEELKPCKEEIMEETNKAIFEGNANCCDIMNDIIKDNIKEREKKSLLSQLIEYFRTTPKDELEREWNEHNELDEIGPTVEEYFAFVESIKKQPKYPKTYKECCDILGYNASYDLNNIITHDCVYDYKLQMLYRVLICRDAYWKIAGEQMELGKPWKPDWNWREYKFCIGTIYDKIEKFHVGPQNYILTFPTEEMRDVFYENFKDLIEECKELL